MRIRVRSGWPVKADPEHVEDLALQGLGPGVEVPHRGDRGRVLGYLDPDADAAGGRQRQQSGHQLEALGADALGEACGRVAR